MSEDQSWVELTPETLEWEIMHDPKMSAAYKLGLAHGRSAGFDAGRIAGGWDH